MNADRSRMHLNAFLIGVGHHQAAWRLPESDPFALTDLDHWIRQARIAEAGKLDSIFLADGLWMGWAARHQPGPALDPLDVLFSLVPVTERIGLVATLSTTFSEPYHIARRLASLDHLSRGRAAWNCVTSHSDAEAANFGMEHHVGQVDRYGRAQEFAAVLDALWDSWQDGALVGDKAAGVYADTDRIREIRHEGETFRVRGPLSTPRSPQGRPVMYQAGSSDTGMSFAARHAEAVFTAQPSLERAQSFYADIKRRISEQGRDAAAVKVLPGLSPIIGSTEAEARAFERRLNELTPSGAILTFLSQILHVPLTEEHLDGPLPELDDGFRWESRAKLIVDMARRESLTVREVGQRTAFARGHAVVVGTAEQVADTMEVWFRQGAADGFNLMPPTLPEGLETFVDHVVPILQERGLFRTEYEGATLRDHLGLPRPAAAWTRSRVAAAAS